MNYNLAYRICSNNCERDFANPKTLHDGTRSIIWKDQGNHLSHGGFLLTTGTFITANNHRV